MVQGLLDFYYKNSLETLRANDNRLALELSRNKKEVRKVEDDAERTTMSFLLYTSLRKGKTELTNKERSELADEVSRSSTNKDLKRCFQSELVVTFWNALASVNNGRDFMNTKYLSSKWAADTILQPGGGVS
jgi:AAA+ ATPase superfamily predicted ATPase